ncbi:hypothetical protein vseg_012365 [Gypsophila vaccaria]
MKKIFFRKSSTSYGDEHNKKPGTRRENKHQTGQIRQQTESSRNVENKVRNSEQCFPICDSKVTETKSLSRKSVLRKSRTLSTSSAAFASSRFSEDNFCGSRSRQRITSSHGECDRSDCHYNLVVVHDRDSKPERYDASPTLSEPSSPHTSFGSSSTLGQVRDLYMDGDHPQEKPDHRLKMVQNRGFSDSNLLIPSYSMSRDDSLRSEHRRESPRKLAKDVVEKLLRLERFHDLKPSEVCDKHLDEQSYRFGANMTRKGCTLREVLDEDISAVNNHRLVHGRVSERAAAKEAPLLLKEEISSEVRIQESEKEMFRSRLQRELDCRSDEWGFKLGEFESEEWKLKDRLSEISEQNVSLQREVSAFYDKERGYTDKISQMEAHLKDMMSKLEELKSENDSLQKLLTDVNEKLKVSEEIQLCMERNFNEKAEENSELVKTVSRLRRTCSEQDKTIDGLRQCLNSETDRRQTSGEIQNVTHKLQLEQARLAEVEQVLRRQLETCAIDVQSLRTENIYLLERLRGTGAVSGRSGLKLDQELQSCVQCLKNTGLSLLTESVQTCDELLKIVRRNGFQENHTLAQYDMKVQGFNQGLDELTRSLAKTGVVLTEKSKLDFHERELSKTSSHVVMEKRDLISELKAESLLTSILKEKLYSKEKEVERVQTELAQALCSREALKSEIQDAYDTVSCLNHKMKSFELQMIEKNGIMDQLRGKVRSQEEELGSTRRTLSKVSQERDSMWEEVKQYAEKNMLLNRELDLLKKKVDELEEDTLLKDGQISILKDSISSNVSPFDALFGADQGEFFKI